MRKPTKAEEKAAEAVQGYAAGTVSMLDTWEAVFAVAGSDGWWHRSSGLVWFAHLSVRQGGNERQLIPCGLSGRVTDEEVKYRFQLGPKPPDEQADAKQVAFNRFKCRAEYLDGVAKELREMGPNVLEWMTKLVQRIEDTRPVEAK